MADKMKIILKFRYLIQDFSSIIYRLSGRSGNNGIFPMPALIQTNSIDTRPSGSLADTIKSIFDTSILLAVPFARRSLEKRLMRKMTIPEIKQTKPKKNLVVCLTCGTYHETQTICGKCYEKVRQETEQMKQCVPDFTYNHPQTEIEFVYQDDTEVDPDMPRYKGKLLVETHKPRPSWWPTDVYSKSDQGN